MPVTSPVRIVEGFFAPFEASAGADEELRVQVLVRCLEEYRSHAPQLQGIMDGPTANFVRNYVLGGLHRTSLHDEILRRLEISFQQEVEPARATLDVSLMDVPGLSRLRIEYFGLADWELPADLTFAQISRHEVLRNGDLLQHTLYTFGNQPISFVFERLNYVEE